MSTEVDLTVTNSLSVTAGDNGNLFAQFTPAASKALLNGRLGISTLNPQNALDISGSTVIGSDYAGLTIPPPNGLAVQGNLGIGTPLPVAKLEINQAPATGDAQALVSHATSTGNDDASGMETTVTVPGGGFAQGVTVNATGAGTGLKLAFSGTASGGGTNYGAILSASNYGASSAGETYGLYSTSSNYSAYNSWGVMSYAGGEGTGGHTAFYGYAYGGGDGPKNGGMFYATQTTSTSTSPARAVTGSAFSYGNGPVTGIDADAGGYGTGTKIGVDTSAVHSGTSYASTYGVYSSATASSAGYAVSMNGNATASNNGYAYGLVANGNVSGSGSGYGVGGSVSGYNAGGGGTAYGLITSAGGYCTGPKYGLYSYAWGSGDCYAAYFSGHVHVAGQLTKSSGTFLIDHPLDPYNRVLRHNFVESPEELCVYRGKVRLDASGQATVTMPSYFVALTKEDEATVTVSPIGRKSFLTSYEWNSKFDAFTVFGDPNAQVSYLVLATRDDPSILVLRRPVEEDKSPDQKGKLLLPAAYPDSKQPAQEIADPVIRTENARFKDAVAKRDDMRKQQRADMDALAKTQDERQKQVLAARDAFTNRRAKAATALKASLPKVTPPPKGGMTK
jgi:hypothetical protein